MRRREDREETQRRIDAADDRVDPQPGVRRRCGKRELPRCQPPVRRRPPGVPAHGRRFDPREPPFVEPRVTASFVGLIARVWRMTIAAPKARVPYFGACAAGTWTKTAAINPEKTPEARSMHFGVGRFPRDANQKRPNRVSPGWIFLTRPPPSRRRRARFSGGCVPHRGAVATSRPNECQRGDARACPFAIHGQSRRSVARGRSSRTWPY